MKTLTDVTPSREQLPIISNPQAGVTLIRGAAGSGKTTTALLMLKQLSTFWLNHRERSDNPNPIRILVLTFNRTLRGYINHLAAKQIRSSSQIQMEVSTFGKWSMNLTGYQNIIGTNARDSILLRYAFSNDFDLTNDFLCGEVDYCLGRFLTDDLEKYISTIRLGRGKTPRLGRSLRKKLLDDVIKPYDLYKKSVNLKDWNDLALELYNNPIDDKYDIIIADETQDFSANQMRAVMKHAAGSSTIVFVLDAAQRIYPRGWTWKEVNIEIKTHRSFHLKENHRNTVEICALARPLLEGLNLTDDGTLPDLNSCKQHGAKPKIIKGIYSKQCSYVITYILNYINLDDESIAFAQPQGGRWFDYLRKVLERNNLNFVDLTRKSDWPEGITNIALITMHSAKGLEFDHIFVLGLNEENTPHGDEEEDSAFENLRRLLAMTITRARSTVTLGCKPDKASSLFEWLKEDTYEEIIL